MKKTKKFIAILMISLIMIAIGNNSFARMTNDVEEPMLVSEKVVAEQNMALDAKKTIISSNVLIWGLVILIALAVITIILIVLNKKKLKNK